MLADLTAELDGQPPLGVRVIGAVPTRILDETAHTHGADEAPADCQACEDKSIVLAFCLFVRRIGGNVAEIKFNDDGTPDIVITWGDAGYQIIGPAAAIKGQ